MEPVMIYKRPWWKTLLTVLAIIAGMLVCNFCGFMMAQEDTPTVCQELANMREYDVHLHELFSTGDVFEEAFGSIFPREMMYELAWDTFWHAHRDCEICLANGDVQAYFETDVDDET